MKKQSTVSFLKMSSTQLETLTTIVKETLATGFEVVKSRTFTAADLWNIQRQGKSRTQRRFSF